MLLSLHVFPRAALVRWGLLLGSSGPGAGTPLPQLRVLRLRCWCGTAVVGCLAAHWLSFFALSRDVGLLRCPFCPRLSVLILFLSLFYFVLMVSRTLLALFWSALPCHVL